MKRSRRLASIDIGTNSTRLLVADCDGSRTVPADRRMTITRLGAGVDETKNISPDSAERVALVLEEYAAAMRELGVEEAVAAATSVLRDCENGGDFLGRVEEILGVAPVVLSGEIEGRLSFLGAVSGLRGIGKESELFVFDIGGGSTEMTAGRMPDDPDDGRKLVDKSLKVKTVSVDIGCVRMSERFLKDDPPSPISIGRMESHLVNELKPVIAELITGEERPAGIALAGTATTVSAINMGLEEYDADRIHHSELSRGDVERIFIDLAKVEHEERKTVMGIEPGRADVIIGGMAVLRAVMDLSKIEQVLISEKDILDGLILNLYHNSGTTSS